MEGCPGRAVFSAFGCLKASRTFWCFFCYLCEFCAYDGDQPVIQEAVSAPLPPGRDSQNPGAVPEIRGVQPFRSPPCPHAAVCAGISHNTPGPHLRSLAPVRGGYPGWVWGPRNVGSCRRVPSQLQWSPWGGGPCSRWLWEVSMAWLREGCPVWLVEPSWPQNDCFHSTPSTG